MATTKTQQLNMWWAEPMRQLQDTIKHLFQLLTASFQMLASRIQMQQKPPLKKKKEVGLWNTDPASVNKKQTVQQQ